MSASGQWGRRGAFVAAAASFGVIAVAGLSLSCSSPGPAPQPTPAPVVSVLRVQSEPSGAAVRVNGQSRGGTPLALSNLPPGLYQVEVELSGYQTARESVALTQAAPSRDVTLLLTPTTAAPQPKTGLLEVETQPPGAQVEVDGMKAGKTPVNDFQLPAGSHSVTVSLAEFESVTRDVQIAVGKAEKLSLLLRSTRVHEAKELDSEVKRVAGATVRLPTQDRPRSVVAMLTIGYDGRVENIEVSGSAGPQLESLFRNTVRGWRYEPGRSNGVPVRFRILLQVKAPVRRR